MRARVAEQAVAAGAALVNDVSGGLADPDMIPAVAAADVPFVVMHWRGFSESMNSRAVYEDVVAEVLDELRRRMDAVVAGGVAPERVVIDPGLGFAKDAAHDLKLVAHLAELHTLGRPLLVAASRKRFLGHVLAGPGSPPPPARERDAATAAVSALAAGRRLGGPGPRGTGHRRRGPRRPRGRGSRVNEEHAQAAADIAEVEAANTAFYEALERGDYEELSGSWLPGEDLTVSCVHPGWPVLTGRGEVLRSYALIMANTEYIQFFLTDVNIAMTGDTALVTCTENILSGGPAEEGNALGPLVGQLVVATNVFRHPPTARSSLPPRTPVLTESDEDEEDPPPDETLSGGPPSREIPFRRNPFRRRKHPPEWVRDR
ncbi:hypothetical protein SBADM41S_03966 [Streptomyces badius]